MKKIAMICLTAFLFQVPLTFADTPAQCSGNSTGNYGCGNPNKGGEPTSSSSCESYYMEAECQCSYEDNQNGTYGTYGYGTTCVWSNNSCSNVGSTSCNTGSYGDKCGCGTN